MITDQWNELLERKLANTRTVLAGKAEEYSHDGDRLSNFKRAAELLQCTPEEALLGFVTKHVIALYDFTAALGVGRCMTLEQWAEKTGDIRNYMLLLDGLIEERLHTDAPTVGCSCEEMERDPFCPMHGAPCPACGIPHEYVGT